MPADQLDHDEIVRIFGPWLPRRPADSVKLFEGYPGRWWIAGGWAIEAFTGIARDHGDLDPSIPRHELPLLRRHLAGRIDLWSADQDTLRVLFPQDADQTLPESCENVWARTGGADPWQYDIILMGLTADTWTFKRDQRISRPVGDIVWTKDGISYLLAGDSAAAQGSWTPTQGPSGFRGGLAPARFRGTAVAARVGPADPA